MEIIMKALFPALYVLLQSAGLTVSAAVSLPNEFCRLRPVVVPIGSPQFEWFPFFVTLHRCIGSCSNIQPTVQHCVATKTIPVQIQVYSPRHRNLKVVTLLNHTECGHECVTQPYHCHAEREIWREHQCKCVCRYENAPAKPCENGYIWDRESCDCVCDKAPKICPSKKVWSNAACACVCKERRVIKRCKRKGLLLNEHNCSCVRAARAVDSARSASEEPVESDPEAVVTVRAAIIFSFVELALLCVVFDSFLYRKQTGFVYGLKTWLCCSTGSSSDEW